MWVAKHINIEHIQSTTALGIAITYAQMTINNSTIFRDWNNTAGQCHPEFFLTYNAMSCLSPRLTN